MQTRGTRLDHAELRCHSMIAATAPRPAFPATRRQYTSARLLKRHFSAILVGDITEM